MPRTARALLLVVAYLSLFGCASLPPNSKRDPRDPWERLNRTTFKVNMTLDHAVARPVARAYQKITPRPVRDSVSNFIDNLFYPVTMANELLQAKFKAFGQSIGRFVLNSTVGVGGLLDPATRIGLPKDDQDLGLTFGHWGSGPGPYFVIPILGPSDVRDGIGRVGDIWLSPPHYISNNYVSYGLWGLGVIDARYRLLPQDKLLDEAYDPYTLLKNAYLQRRQYQITGGNLSQKQEQQEYDEEKRILEEAGPDESQGQPPQEQSPPKADQPPR
jgi:phospholipid-binding lipoprotein MlaA